MTTQTATSTQISVSTAARILRTSNDTVLRMIERGELRGFRYGARGWYKLDYDSVIAMMNKVRDRE